MMLRDRRTTLIVLSRVFGFPVGMISGGIVESWGGRANFVYLERDGGWIYGYLVMARGRMKMTMKTRTMG
jgi:hypothetical protein